MARPDVSAYTSFDKITKRLEEIAGTVRSKDISLERSLDLFDEAIELGAKAVGMVEATDLSERERALIDEMSEHSTDVVEANPAPSSEQAGSESDLTSSAE